MKDWFEKPRTLILLTQNNCYLVTLTHNKVTKIHRIVFKIINLALIEPVSTSGGWGGVLCKCLGGVCRWESKALTLYQTMFSCILRPSSGLEIISIMKVAIKVAVMICISIYVRLFNFGCQFLFYTKFSTPRVSLPVNYALF